MRHARPVLIVAMITLSQSAFTDEVTDFSDLITPICEVSGLNAYPPEGWFNVPIESDDAILRGCQMMRTGEGHALVGVVRMLSVELPVKEDTPPWQDVMISIEHENIGQMGYVVDEVMWVRDTVPIEGQGFANAVGIGFSARIEGSDIPQEAQFLLFEKDQTKYVVTLLTPGRDVDSGEYYERNNSDFGQIIRTMRVPTG